MDNESHDKGHPHGYIPAPSRSGRRNTIMIMVFVAIIIGIVASYFWYGR